MPLRKLLLVAALVLTASAEHAFAAAPVAEVPSARTATTAACSSEPPAWADTDPSAPLPRGPCVVYCVASADATNPSIRRSIAANRSRTELSRWYEGRSEVAMARMAKRLALTATTAGANVCSLPLPRVPGLPEPQLYFDVAPSGSLRAAAAWRFEDFEAARLSTPGLDPGIGELVRTMNAEIFEGCPAAR